MRRTLGRFVSQNTGERNRVCQRLVDKTTASFCSVNRDARPGWETRFSYGERQRPRSSDTPAWMRACMVETTSIMFDVGVIATMGFIGAAFASRARVPIIIGYIIAGMLIGPNIHLRLFGWSYDGILADSVFLLGMVILESFLAMFLLTLVNGMIVPSDAPVNVGVLFGGVGLFIGFFALLAAVVVPRTAAIFERIKSEELFVLFALGTVFLAASLAEAFRIPAIVGAFFMGMVFADTRIAGRMKVKMESLRDAFVAIFFLTFGMLIDPAALGSVLPMLLIAVPLILLNDLFLTASLAYFIGFSGRASTAIGTSLIARNEEAILYATVRARAVRGNPQLSGDYAGTYLTPFAGILCIVMSSLAPILMGRSNRIASFFANRLPKSLRFGAELVKRTLKTVIMPNFLPIYRRKRLFQASVILYAYFLVVVFSMKVVHRRLGLGITRRVARVRLVRHMPAARSWRAASGMRR